MPVPRNYLPNLPEHFIPDLLQPVAVLAEMWDGDIITKLLCLGVRTRRPPKKIEKGLTMSFEVSCTGADLNNIFLLSLAFSPLSEKLVTDLNYLSDRLRVVLLFCFFAATEVTCPSPCRRGF